MNLHYIYTAIVALSNSRVKKHRPVCRLQIGESYSPRRWRRSPENGIGHRQHIAICTENIQPKPVGGGNAVRRLRPFNFCGEGVHRRHGNDFPIFDQPGLRGLRGTENGGMERDRFPTGRQTFSNAENLRAIPRQKTHRCPHAHNRALLPPRRQNCRHGSFRREH